MAKIGYLGLGVLVIIAIVGFMVTRRSPAPSAPTPSQAVTTNEPATATEQAVQQPTAAAATVRYTASGFSPSLVKVKSGSTVTFKNESSEPMWVASDPHPIHTRLRGFDAKNGIGNGQTYSFTFTKAGRFGFHNHLNPSHTGTVVVR